MQRSGRYRFPSYPYIEGRSRFRRCHVYLRCSLRSTVFDEHPVIGECIDIHTIFKGDYLYDPSIRIFRKRTGSRNESEHADGMRPLLEEESDIRIFRGSRKQLPVLREDFGILDRLVYFFRGYTYPGYSAIIIIGDVGSDKKDADDRHDYHEFYESEAGSVSDGVGHISEEWVIMPRIV